MPPLNFDRREATWSMTEWDAKMRELKLHNAACDDAVWREMETEVAWGVHEDPESSVDAVREVTLLVLNYWGLKPEDRSEVLSRRLDYKKPKESLDG